MDRKIIVKINRNIPPHGFADRRDPITGDFSYRHYDPRTGEIYSDLSAGSRIICGYFNCLEIDGLNYWMHLSAFWPAERLEEERQKIDNLFN